GVQQIGADQVVVWANTALLNLLGYSAEEYVGYPLGQFYVQQDVFEEYWLRLMSREDIYDFPAELRCKDGSVKHVLIHSNGLWVGGQFVHTRCFIRDITEHKRMEQTLREKNDALREAVANRDEFLSVAAHELKTPVTSLRGFAQLLLRDTRRKREISSERLESALNAIELHTGKLNQLMERLLNSAQIEAGKLRIELLKTDLVALIHAAIEQQQGDAQQRVIFDGPEQCEAVVDPVRFEQVITNLLDNALKYSPEGGIVTIGLRQGKDCGVELSVTDHGVGIPLDQRAHIFDRFYQAHGERHLSGMGLGLYITREIVYLHGGNLRIEEPEHTGTRFVVTLPSSTDGARPSLERKKVRI
ncbi:MAG: hybrid sensor histidine kinase/response regulator, partial [Chloroflexi bacterium]|nr:hybrid sensor histidine kinase/response regulator [Chloroflexota bacterium]